MLNAIVGIVIIVLLGLIGYATAKHQKEIKTIKEDIKDLYISLGFIYKAIVEKKQKKAGGEKKSQP
jgi:hypothetical protein